MNDLADYLDVNGKTFASRFGSWTCSAQACPESAGNLVVRLRFEQQSPDPRWSGRATRSLTMRISEISSFSDDQYEPWLISEVEAFLNSDRISDELDRLERSR